MNSSPDSDHLGGSADQSTRRTVAITILFLLICLIAVLMTFREHLLAGGHGWNTADWLINADIVHVRRGIFGSALLRVADAFHVSPVFAVILFQSTLAILIATGAIRGIWQSPSPALASLLIISPGFCLVFWAADPLGTARKEMIAYAAMALLLLASGKPKLDRGIVFVAACLFALGASAHIANAVMTPMFLFMAWTALGRRVEPIWVVGAGTMCVWAAFNTWYPIHFSGIASSMDVCRPLLERGVSEELCKDAIRVTSGKAERAVEFVADRAYGGGKWISLLFIYPGILLPVVYLLSRTKGWRALMMPFALSVMPLLPLYVVGLDWGRHVVMHVTPILLLAQLMLLRGQIHQTRPVPGLMCALLIVLGALWAPPHTFDLDHWGLPVSVILNMF